MGRGGGMEVGIVDVEQLIHLQCVRSDVKIALRGYNLPISQPISPFHPFRMHFRLSCSPKRSGLL